MKPAPLIQLHGEEWSLVLEPRDGRQPVWRHFGPRVDPGDLPRLEDLRAPAHFSLQGDFAMPLFPVAAEGWFGPPALEAVGEDGRAIALAFDETAVAHDGDALEIELLDGSAGIAVAIAFRPTGGGGLQAQTRIENRSGAPLTLIRLASLVFPLASGMREIVSFRGVYGAEFAECREAMPEHAWIRETRRGLPGHGGPCGCYVMGEAAGWHSGFAMALQLAWSGDARLAIERDDEGFWTCATEAVSQPGELVLGPGASLAAPPVLLALSTAGRNGAMAQMHGAVRERIDWPGGSANPRPVHLNSWEACYFAHDRRRIVELAQAAADIGAERFVLDDGWFKGRNDDRAALGDWNADPEKYPEGLAPLAEEIRAMGLGFGLWVEPEMVNPDSDLHRAHPDWALSLEGRASPTARNQLVLDMRRAEVRDYLFDRIDALLREIPIEYLKWDHNREHMPTGGAEQVRGTYALLDRLRRAHPGVEIESCAAGGGRIDAGIAAYVHRFWTSDNLDAVARVSIQRGFLAFMPPELMGTHVGARPAHSTGRSQPLDFRAAIACQGHFGIELDPRSLSGVDRDELRRWVGFYKRWRPVIHGGRSWLGEGSDGIVWQAQGNERELLLWVVRRDHGSDRRAQPLRLPFADGKHWSVRLLRHAGTTTMMTPRPGAAIAAMREEPVVFTGSWLAHNGLPVPSLSAESALIYHLEKAS